MTARKDIPSLLLLYTIFSIFVARGYAYRPFYTDDAGTVPAATFEVEAAADYASPATSFGFSIKHGVTERMDIGVSIGRCVHPRHERGFDNAELGLKFSCIPDLLAASFAARFADPDYTAMAILTKSVGGVDVHANGGFTAAGGSDAVSPVYGTALAYNWKKWLIGAEIHGEETGLTWWQAAIKFAFTDWLVADSGIGGDFKRPASITVTAGLFLAFPVKGER